MDQNALEEYKKQELLRKSEKVGKLEESQLQLLG